MLRKGTKQGKQFVSQSRSKKAEEKRASNIKNEIFMSGIACGIAIREFLLAFKEN